MRRTLSLLSLWLVMNLATPSSLAQWTSQTLTLHPGWNAVFLEVQPEPADCDTLFAGLPVESAWAWNRRFSTVQFIQDPDTLVPAQPGWLTYWPPAHPAHATRNLFVLQGGRAYLIKLAANAGTVTWSARGQPVLRGPEWVPDSFNLVGFTVDAQQPPTFQAFFAASLAHAGKPVYRLSASGAWEKVASLASATLRPGEAFWIRSDGPSTYAGPLDIDLERRHGLAFERVLMEQPLRLVNTSTSVKTLTLRPRLSEGAPQGQSAVAGPVPLSFYWTSADGSERSWVPLTGPLTQANLAPGAEWLLRLAVRRVDMATSSDLLYQSLLEVSDGAGLRRLIPVSAYPLHYSAGTGTAGLAGGVPPGIAPPSTGLWVGNVTIDRVSQPSNIENPLTPVPAGSEFPFRLIMHVGTNGQTQLLRQVLIVWQEATYTNDANGLAVVDRPRQVTLRTDDGPPTPPGFGGPPHTQRISSAAFGHANPLPMTLAGTFGASNATASCALTLGYDDPLNPFKHRYHPDHDNLDARFERILPNRAESYDITRTLQLRFDSTNLVQLPLAGWGDSHLGGDYTETIAGLHRRPLYLSGTFHLQRVSSVGVLTRATP